MPTFTYPISYSSQLSIKPKVLLSKFGDGYEQRVPDGLNTALEVWQIQCQNMANSTAADAVDAFLRTQAGVTSFTWTTPFGRTALFVCREWTRTPTTYIASSITAKFEEVMV